MKKRVTFLLLAATLAAQAFVFVGGAGGVTGGQSGDSQHAWNVDNATGTNVFLTGSFAGDLSRGVTYAASATPFFIGTRTDQYGYQHDSLAAVHNYYMSGGVLGLENAGLTVNGNFEFYPFYNFGQGLELLQCNLTVDMGGSNIQSAGVVSAQQFQGGGAGLTGVTVSSNQVSGHLNAGQVDGLTDLATALNSASLYTWLQPLWTSAAATAAQQATNGLTINSNQISGPLNAGQIAGLPGTLLFTNATPLYSTRAAGTNGSGGGNNYYLYATVPPGRYYISAFFELDSAISGQGQYGGFYITNSQANLYGVNYRSSSDNVYALALRMGLSSQNGYAPPQFVCWSQSGGGTYAFANGEGILTCTVTNYIWAQIQTYFAGWTNQPWLNTNSFIYLRAF